MRLAPQVEGGPPPTIKIAPGAQKLGYGITQAQPSRRLPFRGLHWGPPPQTSSSLILPDVPATR